MTPRTGLVVAAMLAVFVIAAELTAPVLAQRALLRALGPCVEAEEVAITELSRPVLPQLLTGRARSAEVVATGVVLGELRVERVEAAVTRLDLPWRVLPGDDDSAPIDVTAVITAPDAREALQAITPFGLQPTLRFVGGEVVIGAPGLGIDARFVPVLAPGEVALVPAIGAPQWWTALGLALRAGLPDGVTVASIDVGGDRVRAQGQVVLGELTPGGRPRCETPVAAPVEGAAQTGVTAPAGVATPVGRAR